MSKNTNAMWRASIIYAGKYAETTGCAFLTAANKEAAKKYIESLVKEALKTNGHPNEPFKIEITTSSNDEIDFYQQNKKKHRYYNGLAN